MMKALLFCPVHGHAEWDRYFPGYPVSLLPFANKPAIEFMLDYCVLGGIRDVRIMSDEESGRALRAQYRNGEILGLNLSFGAMIPGRSLKHMIRQNMAFCRGNDLLIFSGLFLPEYDKRNPHELSIESDEMKGCSDGSAAWYMIGRDRLADLPDDWSGFRDDAPVRGVSVTDIRDYYTHNMRLAGSDIEKYNLPGFSEGKHSFIGCDVQIPRSARVKSPVILGNGIQFGHGVHAGPKIIVGDNCIIDSGANILNSIVLGNTYIGRNTKISGKICFGDHLIDPSTGSCMVVANEAVLSEVVPDGHGRCPVYLRILALFLLLLQTLPYFLLRPFLEIHSTLAECLMWNGRKDTIPIDRYAMPRGSLAGRLFRSLTLNKYHLLSRAVAGKLRLVGNRLLEATEHNEAFIRDLPGYAPGVFSYSEYLGHENEPYQIELDEHFYAYAMNCWVNIKILLGILRYNLSSEDRIPQQRGVFE